MAVPNFLTGTFGTDMRYLALAAVTDVQTIMDNLHDELVTNLGWTQTVGVRGNTSQTFKSPVGAYGSNEFFTVNLQRAGVAAQTTLQIIVTDGYGMLVNNILTGHGHLFIDGAGGNDVFLFTGNTPKPYLCIDSERVSAAPEMWWACQLDRYPEVGVRPTWITHPGPRTAAEALSYAAWDFMEQYPFLNTTTYAYAGPAQNIYRLYRPTSGGHARKTQTGALIFSPIEVSNNGFFYGRAPQALFVDSGQAFKAELVVPIDSGVTATFRVVGGATGTGPSRMCWRKA